MAGFEQVFSSIQILSLPQETLILVAARPGKPTVASRLQANLGAPSAADDHATALPDFLDDVCLFVSLSLSGLCHSDPFPVVESHEYYFTQAWKKWSNLPMEEIES